MVLWRQQRPFCWCERIDPRLAELFAWAGQAIADRTVQDALLTEIARCSDRVRYRIAKGD